MKWFNNLKVAQKVLISCLVFIILIVAISGQGIIRANGDLERFQRFYEAEYMAIRQLNRIMRNILQIRVNMLQVYQAAEKGDDEIIIQRNADSDELSAAYMKEWEAYKSTLFSDEGKKLAEEWEVLLKEPANDRRLFKEFIKNSNIEEAAMALDRWVVGYRLLRDKTDVLIDTKAKLAEHELNDTIRNTKQVQLLNISVLVISIIVGFIITVLLSSSVSKPVNKGLLFANRLADGDFTERIDLDQRDELGMLGKALNKAADDLEKTISEIIVGMQNLTQAVQEISSGNENLSQRTSEQASSLEEIASTIEESSATINQNADNSREANKLSQNTSVIAQEGGRVMDDAVMAINEINVSSKKIADIITVINDISFQTNLLALNAAVEAARAGEQGRGFAVVAGEVRNLAQRSGNAAKEIAELIKDSLTKVDKGTELANKSGESLKEIISSIESVTRFVSEIAASSDEQKQGTAQINTAVAELDSMTQQNASLVEETASASEEMANQAQELLALMEKFKIRQNLYSDLYKKKHTEIHLRSSKGESALKKTAPRAALSSARVTSPAPGSGNQSAAQKSAVSAQISKEKSIEDILTNEGFEEF